MPQEKDARIEGVPFGLLNEGESGTMIVIADIGKQPESADGPLGSMMLKANFMYDALDGYAVSPFICDNFE